MIPRSFAPARDAEGTSANAPPDWARAVDVALAQADAEAPLMAALDDAVDALGADAVIHHLRRIADADGMDAHPESRRAA